LPTKQMALRRSDRCAVCSHDLPAGTRAEWNSELKEVICLDCVASRPATPAGTPPGGPEQVAPADEPIDVGVAGVSARKEYARRQAKRDRQLEQKWGTGRIGKIAKALSDDPQSTRAWKDGAVGEERVAAVLHERLGDSAVLLHDRKVPGTRGNLDHIAVASSGVWIIDAKRYKGKVEKRDKGGWFKSDIRLYVGGRDRTKLIEAMGWQHDAVFAVLALEDVPVHCALTFVGAEWPLFFAKPLHLGDVWVSWPAALADLVAKPGPLEPDDVERVARLLAATLPANRS
jgi:hypothetical protein